MTTRTRLDVEGVRMFNYGFIAMIPTQISLVTKLTHIARILFPDNIQKSIIRLSFASGVVFSLGSTSVSLAQSTSNQPLPPPPILKNVTPASPETVPIPLQDTTPSSDNIRSTEITPSQPLKEYTFQAPQTPPNQTLSNSDNQPLPAVFQSQPTPTPQPVAQPRETPSFYRVEVTGNQTALLSQVKVIEPMAFIRKTEGVIHAGMFQTSQQAQERVNELLNQGVNATIVPVYRGKKRSLLVEIRPE